MNPIAGTAATVGPFELPTMKLPSALENNIIYQ